ncbi:hypothetical protein BDQ17DRAFT_1422335 [Cyathus striatus]|nr:hypothetical protein BDQ17DRAFT_1422335 [Cyathus striatus]
MGGKEASLDEGLETSDIFQLSAKYSLTRVPEQRHLGIARLKQDLNLKAISDVMECHPIRHDLAFLLLFNISNSETGLGPLSGLPLPPVLPLLQVTRQQRHSSSLYLSHPPPFVLQTRPNGPSLPCLAPQALSSHPFVPPPPPPLSSLASSRLVSSPALPPPPQRSLVLRTTCGVSSPSSPSLSSGLISQVTSITVSFTALPPREERITNSK